MYWQWRGSPGIPKYGDLLVDVAGLKLPNFNKAQNAESLASVIADEVDSLPEKEKNTISFLYGFNEKGEVLTLEETGKRMGLTGERVRQIEFQALKRLREKIIRVQLISRMYL